MAQKKDKTKRSLSGLCAPVRDKNYSCSFVKFVAKKMTKAGPPSAHAVPRENPFFQNAYAFTTKNTADRAPLCPVCIRSALMCDPVTKSNFKEGIKNNFQIKKERSIPEIVLFELDLDRDREFVTAVDLRPPG